MSRKKAIDNKCKDCAYDPLAEGTWRTQVSKCIAKTCPLWLYRPLPSGLDEDTLIALKTL